VRCLLFALLWLLLVIALTCFASLAPATIGIGSPEFGDSFALVRAMVLLTSVCGMGLAAHSLQLWDVSNLAEMLNEMRTSRALKRALYVLLLTQLALYAVVALIALDYSSLICFVGLMYLDTKAPNLLVAYVLLTAATLPLDAVTLCTLRYPSSFLQWSRSSAYLLIVLLKCCGLVGMVMLHTKVKFALKLRRSHRRSSLATPTSRRQGVQSMTRELKAAQTTAACEACGDPNLTPFPQAQIAGHRTFPRAHLLGLSVGQYGRQSPLHPTRFS